MSRLSKVRQTDSAKKKYQNPTLSLIKKGTDREELRNLLNCTDSQARHEVAEISLFYPVISSSGSKGYRLPKNIEEMSESELEEEIKVVERTLNEHLSRVKCLRKKCKPLIAWLKVAEKKKNEEVKNENN